MPREERPSQKRTQTGTRASIERRSPAGRRILIIDNYRSAGSKQIRQLRQAVEGMGYETEVLSHRDAEKLLKEEGDKAIEDMLEGYHAYVSSGSGVNWARSGEKSKTTGNEYLKQEGVLHKRLAEHDKPGYHICAGADGLAAALGYKVQDTGKFNRKRDQQGHQFNHKFGVAEEDIDDRVKDIETFEHAGGRYVKAFNIGNKRAVKYHAERSPQGLDDLRKFLEQYAGEEQGQLRASLQVKYRR